MRIQWGLERQYSYGVDRGVLYLKSGAVPWNGLVGVAESTAGAEQTTTYIDGVARHTSELLGENFTGDVQAYTYPDVLDEGPLATEGFSYRTQTADGYLIHVVYSTLFVPSSRTRTSIGENIDPALFKWDISSLSKAIPGSRPTSHLVIDANAVGSAVGVLESYLYGTSGTIPELPTPQELVDIFEVATTIKVTQFGDGIYTVEGPDDLVKVYEDGTFTIDAPSVFIQDTGIFTVRSY